MSKEIYIERYHQNEFLLAYLRHELSNEERIDFESYLANSEMLQDALTGLKSIHSIEKIQHTQAELATFLGKQTQRTKLKKKAPQYLLIYTTVAVILLLVFVFAIYIYIQNLAK